MQNYHSLLGGVRREVFACPLNAFIGGSTV